MPYFEIMKSSQQIFSQNIDRMGAALCTNTKSVKVEPVRSKKGLKSLDEEGHEDFVGDQDQNGFMKSNVARPNEKLWQAVELNDLFEAEKYLDFNEVFESNLYDQFGQTMIHKAASLGSAEMLMLLIERTGAKPDLVNQSLATPLHLACRNGKDNIVKFLIGCGVEVNLQDEHGQTPLLICCIHGNYTIMQMLVEASNVGHLPEPLEVDLPNHQGLTALNCAAIKGDLEMVKCLVSRGQAKIDQVSPKGCTPLIYAGRGGYEPVVEFLIEKKADALKQDNAGGTVLHHAIEKSHIGVLETMLANGINIYSAIEIADNTGRTPLFEAVENLNGEDHASAIQIIDILTKDRQEGGFGANPNVINYNGQTPLFAAARQGSLLAVKALFIAGAKPDLNKGELVKMTEEEAKEAFDDADEDISQSEKNFMTAFKNCCTPLQVALVLGYDDIALLLAQQCQADVNYPTKNKGYTALHLLVLADRPEMIMDLLTKTAADPLIDDFEGRALLDMVYQFMPNYVEVFQSVLEKMDCIKKMDEEDSKPAQASAKKAELPYVDDNRAITGKKTQAEIQDMYAKQMEVIQEDEQDPLGQTINLQNIIESDLLTEAGNIDSRIEKVFGAKVALCIVGTNWQNKEQAMKYVARNTEKFIIKSSVDTQTIEQSTLSEIIQASLVAISLTCREKVIKVFNVALKLFNTIIQCQRIEQDTRALKLLIHLLQAEEIIHKFLVQSEQSNTRVAAKIHEALLDLAYQPYLGEDMVVRAVFEQIKRHNQQNSNPKGMLAQLALLYKLVNSFNVTLESDDVDDPRPLSKEMILEVVLPSCSHTKDDIRSAAIKIIVDVQKQTGTVTLNDLREIPEKIRESLWEKVSSTIVQCKGLHGSQTGSQLKMQMQQEQLHQEEAPSAGQQGKLTNTALQKYKQTVTEKGQHKDWTQREIALLAIQECFNQDTGTVLTNEEEFLVQCSILIQSSLDDNNIQMYLIAIEILSQFVQKVSSSEALLDALPSLLHTVSLRTTDTNTRVRKRSCEVINQVWEIQQLNSKANETSSQMVATVLCDQTEKAIVGRLGLFIKKALLIESQEDLSERPLNLILGKDYEQIAAFACQWCLHKNTKVRQCALKLAVEICRLNSIDSRGEPFKQRIVNYILALRSSIRDPLVKKINEVCKEAKPQVEEQFINEQELEFQQATKARAASYDVRRKPRPTSSRGGQSGALPSIGKVSALPSVAMDSNARPTLVLPHSEQLTDAQKESAAQFIELLSLELITCFYSQTWSTRQAAIQKFEEQQHNLDPRRRDAMSGEINRGNLPPEMSFSILIKFFQEGLKDPVLKNYITILELIQSTLPIYIRNLRPEQIKREISPLITCVINKMSDLKQKVREASMNFCLYISHQVEIGCEPMIKHVLSELESVQWERSDKKQMANQENMANAFGNSNMIVSCLNLLTQFQLQTQLVAYDSEFYAPYSLNINRALKHSNPQVRKEGDSLFKLMFNIFGEAYTKELKDQKPALLTKLIAEAKAESQTDKNKALVDAEEHQNQDNAISESQSKADAQAALRDDYLSQPAVMLLLKGNEDMLQQLKLLNPKKRLIAIVEIKKTIQQKLTQMNTKNARELVEPLSVLLRYLLRDENVEVFLEALNLLKFVVGNLAQHLSALDLHLMMGQFISVIVGCQNQNMKARIASDKVIVYFAKHTNIGSLVVAKEVLKNIERFNRSAPSKVDEQWEDKKLTLIRFYSILQMMLQQFSIVLCYQPDFYQKCIDLLAETMQKFSEEPSLKSTCTQLVISLHQIDQKLLDEAVQKLDFTKKAHLKKICIELEQTSQKGLVNQNQNLVSGMGRPSSPEASFRDTQQSFTSLASRQSIMSPASGLNMNRRLQRDRNSEVRTSNHYGQNQNTESKQNVTATPENNSFRRSGTMNEQQAQTGMGWLERKQQQEQTNNSLLPSIGDVGSNTNRKRQVGQGFGGGTAKAAGFNRNDFNMTNDFSNNAKKAGGIEMTSNAGFGSQNTMMSQGPKRTLEKDNDRPPLYVPSQRATLVKKPPVDTSAGYQPTIMSRGGNSGNDDLTNRYRPSLYNHNPHQTNTSSFGGISSSEKMGTTTSTMGQMKPPAAATFQVRQPLEEQGRNNLDSQPVRKNSFY